MGNKEDFWGADLTLDLDLDLGIAKENKNLYVSTKSVNPKAIKYENAVKLAKQIDLIKEQRYECLIKGNFIYGDFIEAFFVENNIYTEELTISTLSFGLENIDSLYNLVEGGFVGKVRILSSVYFYANERKKGGIIDYLYSRFTKEQLECAFADVHTKCVLFKTEGGKHIVMNGSANLRSSGCVEQFSIENNKEVFDFYKAYHDTFFKIFEKDKKPIRSTKLNKIL